MENNTAHIWKFDWFNECDRCYICKAERTEISNNGICRGRSIMKQVEKEEVQNVRCQCKYPDGPCGICRFCGKRWGYYE